MNMNARAVTHPRAASELLVAPIGLPIDLSMCLLALYTLPHMPAPIIEGTGSLNSCPGIHSSPFGSLSQEGFGLDTPAG